MFLVNSRLGNFRCGPCTSQNLGAADERKNFADERGYNICVYLRARLWRASASICGASKLCEMHGQALFQSYGRFFAEFLEDLSLVRLALLELTTCVGLRYGLLSIEA